MKTGAYVVGRHLAMSGLASLGVHQFIVLVPENPKRFGFPTKDLGDGSMGVVIGAYNVNGRLQSEQFADSDYQTIRQLLMSKLGKISGVQVEKVNLEKTMCLVNMDSGLERILRTALNYKGQEEKKPIPYPAGLSGQLSTSCLNSNSWAQTVIELAVGKGAVPEDFDGVDLCSNKRIDPSFFRPE